MQWYLRRHSPIDFDVEVLVVVAAAQLPEAHGPYGAADTQVLTAALPSDRLDQPGVDKVHPDLADGSVLDPQEKGAHPVIADDLVRVVGWERGVNKVGGEA